VVVPSLRKGTVQLPIPSPVAILDQVPRIVRYLEAAAVVARWMWVRSLPSAGEVADAEQAGDDDGDERVLDHRSTIITLGLRRGNPLNSAFRSHPKA
jgi:hypothetical protein